MIACQLMTVVLVGSTCLSDASMLAHSIMHASFHLKCWLPSSCCLGECQEKVKDVVGLSTFDDLIGALMLLHNVNIDCKFSEHCDEFAGPAEKKSSK